MIGKASAGLAAALTFAVTATVAAAGPAAVGGGVGGIGAMGAMGAMGINVPAISMSAIPRIGGGGSTGGIGSMSGSLQSFPFPTNDPNHYHEIRLVGRVTRDESGLTIDQQIVRMRVDGRTIPMSINGDAMSDSLQLDQGDELGQDLYRLILSRQLQVVGDRKLRDRI